MRLLDFCRESLHEVEVILLEDGVNLEGDFLHDLAVVGVVDDEEVLGIAVVVACLEVEGAAEDAVGIFLADLVGDDFLDVADDVAVLSIFFRKIMNRILVAISQGWSRHHIHIDASCPYIFLRPIGNSRHDVIWRRRASTHSLHQGRCQ